MSKSTETLKRMDLYKVHPKDVVIEPGFNPRIDFETNFEELVQSIMENNVKNPIRFKLSHDDRVILRNGERRVRAALEAIKRGADIQWIPAMKERNTMSDAESLFLAYVDNDSLPLSPVEEAGCFGKLKNYGYSIEAISKKIGKSATYIKTRLALIDASQELKEAVTKKEIPITTAKDIVEESSGRTDKQNEKLNEVKKDKASKKTVQKKLKKELKQRIADKKLSKDKAIKIKIDLSFEVMKKKSEEIWEIFLIKDGEKLLLSALFDSKKDVHKAVVSGEIEKEVQNCIATHFML